MTAGRVVHVVSYFPPHVGGMENVVQRIAERHARLRDVEVVTTNRGAPNAARTERAGRLTIRRLPALEVAKLPVAPGMLVALLRGSPPAVLHVHVAQALIPEIGWLAASLRRRPFVAHLHLDVPASGRFGRVFLAYKRWVLPRTLRAANRVITLSEAQAQLVVSRYRVPRERVVVVPNGVGAEYFAAAGDRPARGETTRLLFVGRLSAQKNVARLIAAIPLVEDPVELTVVGDGPCRGEVEDCVGRYAPDQVRLVGARHGAELIEWYRWADMLVMPSDIEGCPLVVLEAMASGVPVVATDVSGNTELVGGAGLLTEPTPEAVAAAITRLARDDALRAELSERGRQRASSFDWDRIAGQFAAIYEDVAR